MQSRAGFGFGHDGSVDSLTRFLNGVRVVEDRDVADLIAFLLSVSGSDTGAPESLPDPSPPAAVGRQLTLASGERPVIFDAMLALARSPTSRVDLIAKGFKNGIARGWFYQRETGQFQSDRQQEAISPEELVALAQPGNEITFTIVSRGSGVRLGIDRDLDGVLDRDELDAGSNPADLQMLPQILGPSPSLVAIGTDLTLDAHIAPLPAIGQLQWRKEGLAIDGATNSSLVISNVSGQAAGNYSVTVTTAFQAYDSLPFGLSVAPLLLSVTPDLQRVRLGSNAQFTASASGVGPFSFQWQFNGREVSGPGSASFVVSNAQLSSEGQYRVIAANQYGAITSAPVALIVLINPVVVIPPLNQAVVAGGNATFSVMISGHPPPFGYQLRKSSSVLTNYTSDQTTGFLSLLNVQPTNAGTYRIVVTNAANPSPGLSLDPVTLTVLADSDHDGLPDDWENAHGLNPNDPADAGLDFDLDGQTNWQEYIAGTDPQDPQSFLKIQQIGRSNGGGAAVIQFNALSNRTYSVQSKASVPGAAWSKLADWVAFASNRVVSVTNMVAPEGSARVYRLVTPRLP